MALINLEIPKQNVAYIPLNNVLQSMQLFFTNLGQRYSQLHSIFPMMDQTVPHVLETSKRFYISILCKEFCLFCKRYKPAHNGGVLIVHMCLKEFKEIFLLLAAMCNNKFPYRFSMLLPLGRYFTFNSLKKHFESGKQSVKL